jgi:hypothetical protein
MVQKTWLNSGERKFSLRELKLGDGNEQKRVKIQRKSKFKVGTKFMKNHENS